MLERPPSQATSTEIRMVTRWIEGNGKFHSFHYILLRSMPELQAGTAARVDHSLIDCLQLLLCVPHWTTSRLHRQQYMHTWERKFNNSTLIS